MPLSVGYEPVIQEEPDKLPRQTLYPQWRTVVTVSVLSVAILVGMCLPVEESRGRAACVILATAFLWMTEAIPLMITGLLPTVLFPFFGIMDTKEVCSKYFNYVSMLMLGTLLIAESFERCGLHRRLALKILSILGRGEALLMLGAMVCTWLLSMFMSNTATTAMMLPIVDAIITSLKEVTSEVRDPGVKYSSAIGGDVKLGAARVDPKRLLRQFQHFSKGLLLCVPYGASIGGIATLTGTPPNLILQTVFEASFPNQKSLDYKTWLFMAFPLSTLLLINGWTVLCLVYARKSWLNLITFRLCCDRSENNTEREKWRHINRVIRVEYRKLGPMTFTEVLLGLIVLLLVLLWLFMLPDAFPGWAERHAELLGQYDERGELKIFLKDTWVVMAMVFLLFIIPTGNPFRGRCQLHPKEGERFERLERLLNQDTYMTKTPWDVLFILGGGYAIAAGCKDSGLSLWIGEQFSFLQNSHHVVIALVVAVLMAVLTEFASNTASTTLLLPVLISLSQAIQVHPLYLMMTGTISSSLAFCLPSATGANALVFAFKELRVMDMIRTGIVMNVLSVLLTILATSTWIYSSLHLDEYPCWADLTDNITCTDT